MAEVLKRMEQHRGAFTPNEKLIYEYILRNPEDVAQMTTTALAEACGVSQPALTRFVKTLGYARYQDFRTDLVAWQARSRTQAPQSEGHLPYFATLRHELDLVEGVLSDSYLRELADYVNSFQRVFATGVAKSRQPASLLETLMIKTGRFFHAVAMDNLREVCDSLMDTDLLVVFTISGTHQSFRSIEQTAGKVLVVTASATSSLAAVADRQVVLPVAGASAEASSISPVIFDAFVELLVEYLVLE